MKKILLLLSYIFIVGVLHAQEICNNGFDDDGDGFIDCFDSDCSEDSACDGFYLGNDAACDVAPSEYPDFSMSLDWMSQGQTADHLSRMAIGDLDGDGMPEVVTRSRQDSKIFIISGQDGSLINERTLYGYSSTWTVAIGNIPNPAGTNYPESCSEIFVVVNDGSWKVMAFNCNLDLLWVSKRISGKDPVHPSLADFDGDGKVELYIYNSILDAETGTIIVQGNDNRSDFNGGGVAVDMFGDANLELVSGGVIYDVRLNSRAENAGTLTPITTIPGGYQWKVIENSTSIADYNLDGNLDVILSGQASGYGRSNWTTVFFWDVYNEQVIKFQDPSYNWKNGTGRLNIGDLDGDGQMNVSYVTGRYLYALDENFNLKWRKSIQEETSGITGCTLFDFNGDGKNEIVYRDEGYLYIINGDGSTNTTMRCVSRTNLDYPIVADVDADGASELCVVCATNDNMTRDEFYNDGNWRYGQVRAYKSAGEPWVPARRLWNQHAYFNVNVNNDLTIPRRQQKHHLIWSTGDCTEGPNRPLNGFLNQSPFLSSTGCPTYARPDIYITENSVTIEQPKCPDEDFKVTFTIGNKGDTDISGNLPITFYEGDPMTAGTTRLKTEYVAIKNLKVGDEVQVDMTVSGNGGDFALFVVVNDNGSTVPLPDPFEGNTDFLECDYDNIVSAEVHPTPFEIDVDTTPHFACISTAPGNGSASAYRLVGSNKLTADYNFYWYDSAGINGGNLLYEGPTITGLRGGTYYVYAEHKTALCSSDSLEVIISETTKNVEAGIVVESDETDCGTPNGRLRAFDLGGAPASDFTFEWYFSGDITTVIGVGPTIDYLSGGSTYGVENQYTVIMTEKLTGCSDSENEGILNLKNVPYVVASKTDISCSSTALDGEVSVIAYNSSDSSLNTNVTYEWYQGSTVKPTPDFTGATWSNLDAGNYTVVAINNGSGCSSDTVTVTVERTTPPSVTASVLADNSSCDDTNPNGQAEAVPSGGTAPYTYNWYQGQNTSGSILQSGALATGLGTGTFTVEVIDANGCSGTAEVTINKITLTREIDVVSTDNSNSCNNPDGRIEVNVTENGVTADLTEYTFYYYSGPNVDTNALIGTGDEVFDGLDAGTYTITAVHSSTDCHTIDPVTVDITSPVIDLMVNYDGLVYPVACDSASGTVVVDISTVVPSTFTVEWYQDNMPVTPGSRAPDTVMYNVIDSAVWVSVEAATYTALVIDENTGCQKSIVYSLPSNEGYSITFEVDDITASTKCSPGENGSIDIEFTPNGSTPVSRDNYLLRIYSADDLNTILEEVIGTQFHTFDSLAAGDYFMSIAANPNGPNAGQFEYCGDNYLTATVPAQVDYPMITVDDLIHNTNCMDQGSYTFNGEIDITVNTPVDASYILNWYEGAGTQGNLVNPANINGDDLIDLEPGEYTVEIIDASGASEFCSIFRTYTIENNPPTYSVGDFTPSHIISCNSQTGSIVIDYVNINGTPQSATNGSFMFEWYQDVNQTTPLNVGVASGSYNEEYHGLPAGTYYVKAISQTGDFCTTGVKEITLEDRIDKPVIDAVSFTNPTACANPNVDGELSITVINGLSNGGAYDIEWFETSDPTTVIGTTPTLSPINAGEYRVVVTVTTTGCTVEGNYILVEERQDVIIRTSVTQNSKCVDPGNGAVSVSLVNVDPADYDYLWTLPDGSNNSNNIITDLGVTDEANGDTYLVRVSDRNDPTCYTESSVVLTSETSPVVPTIEMVAPSTVCDLDYANGAASARVDGGYVGYTFEWFEGDDLSNVVATGPDVSKLKGNVSYTVRATNVVSGCYGEVTSEAVPEQLVIPITPSISVISDDIGCYTVPRGELVADVEGEVNGYTFTWYEVLDDDKYVEIGTGDRLKHVTAGIYGVVAMDNKTHCTSPIVKATIIHQDQLPEFTFSIVNAKCGNMDGSITLIPENSVAIKSIIWVAEGNDFTERSQWVGSGITADSLAEGIYNVQVTSIDSCVQVGSVEILPEVNPHNGISRNGDGQNDFFEINCIGSYPNNIVKIFNRAGTLVYEAEGYDNETIYFDGVSNKGFSIMGTDLPDGTYFYVIDKRNGSRPMSGYIEIVN